MQPSNDNPAADRPAISRAEIDAALARSSWRLRFPRGLESFFEHDTSGQRCRDLFHMGLIGTATLQVLLLPLKLMIGDIFPLVLAMQLGVVTPLNLLILCFLRTGPRPIWRELCVVLVTMTAVASISWLTLQSASPHRWAVPQMFTLAFLYITAMQRLRFLPALIACVLMALADLYLMSCLPQYDAQTLAASMLVFLGAVGFALCGTYVFERQQRQRYLFALLTRLQNTELDRLSHHDPLTGLGNRRLLDEAIQQAQKMKSAELLSVILLDIDHFKKLNDAIGHPAGDRCLVRVAGVIQAELRDHRDHAFRYGGEEFVVLLHNTTQRVALNVAERIRYAIESAGIRNPGLGAQGRITASLGVATMAMGRELDAEELVAMADQALYSAKRAGRNTVYRTSLLDDGTVITAAAA